MAARGLWLDTFFNDDIANGASFTPSLMSTFTQDATRLTQMTLTRTIIGIDLSYTVYDSGEGSQLITVGTGVISQSSFDVATSVPDPATPEDFPPRGWVWRNRYRVWGFAADQQAVFARRVDLDIRAQRKLENGISYMRFNNAAVEGVASVVRVTGIVRQYWLVM